MPPQFSSSSKVSEEAEEKDDDHHDETTTVDATTNPPQADDVDLRIVGGVVPTMPNRYPYLASLQYFGGAHICGGSVSSFF
jgi:hypothetical protein